MEKNFNELVEMLKGLNLTIKEVNEVSKKIIELYEIPKEHQDKIRLLVLSITNEDFKNYMFEKTLETIK